MPVLQRTVDGGGTDLECALFFQPGADLCRRPVEVSQQEMDRVAQDGIRAQHVREDETFAQGLVRERRRFREVEGDIGEVATVEQQLPADGGGAASQPRCDLKGRVPGVEKFRYTFPLLCANMMVVAHGCIPQCVGLVAYHCIGCSHESLFFCHVLYLI